MTVPYPYDSLECVRETAEHWWFHCCWHSEKEASLCVNKTNPYKLFYRCWGCNENGSAFDFAKRMKLSTKDIPPITDAATILERRYKPDIDWKGRLLEWASNNYEFDLADRIGVDVATIQKWLTGFWNNRYLVPMYDKQGICGIQQRWYEGDKCVKRCQRYSKHGWFIPANIPSLSFYRDYDKIFITEGWSDAAVILDLGYLAIGRFNALTVTSCPIHLNQFQRVYIISDTDKCGATGSRKLQKLIPNSKVIYPCIKNSDGVVTDYWTDIREMVQVYGKRVTKEWLKKQLKRN